MNLSIDINKVNNIGASFASYIQTLERCRQAVDQVKRNCPGSGFNRMQLMAKLNAASNELGYEKGMMGAMKNGLNSVVSLYVRTENGLCGLNTPFDFIPVGPIIPITPVAPWWSMIKPIKPDFVWNILENLISSAESNGVSWKWKDTWKMIQNAGVIGGGISLIGNLITGELFDSNQPAIKRWGSAVDTGKFLTKEVGNIASMVGAIAAGSGASTPWWNYLIGTNNGMSGITSKTFSGAFAESIKKQFTTDLGIGTGAVSTADKVKIGAKWAGHILTLAGNVVDNTEEYQKGGMSRTRYVGEIAVETAVDIGIGAASTALVGAAAAALGVTAAPAIVVGAGAVAITWGANAVCKWVTGGKDIGEVVADATMDFVEGAGKVINNVGKGAVEVGKGVANAVGEFGKGVGNAVDSFTKGVSAGWKKIFG